MNKTPLALHTGQHLVLSVVKILVILLTCISFSLHFPIVHDVEPFSYAYFLWCSICSDILPIIILFYFLFIYFWLRWVFVAVCSLSLVVASGGYSSLRCAGFSLWWLLVLRSTGSRHVGFGSCGMRAQ